jgi:hypothetical protein
MGYTHYLELKSKKDVNLEDVQKDVQEVLINNSNLIQRECDNDSAPACYIDSNDGLTIAFNGIGDMGHDTFYFNTNDLTYNFCKTARKPYDEVVCKVLLILKKHFGDAIRVSSDGISGNIENVMTVEGDSHSNGWEVAGEYMRENFA